MKKAKFGSVSHGSLNIDHLFDRFIPFLFSHDHPHASRIKDEREKAKDDRESLDVLLGECYDAMAELAPAGAYFGAHEGDGADIGFWICDSFDEEERYLIETCVDVQSLIDENPDKHTIEVPRDKLIALLTAADIVIHS